MACKSHPRAPAGWECVWCKEELCPDCVARRQTGLAQHDVCIRCGGPAQPLRRLRSDTPYSSRLADAWKYPFIGNGLWAIGGAAIVLWLLNLIGAGRWSTAILWAYVFSLIRANANGKNTIEAPDFSEIGEDLVMPSVRGAVATAIVWVPAVLYLQFGRAEPPVFEPPPEEVNSQLVVGDDLYKQVFEPEGGGAFPIDDGDEPAFEEPGFEAYEGDAPGFEAAVAELATDALATEDTIESVKASAAADTPPPPLHRDPIFLLLIVFGVLYVPMALLVAATGGGVFQMLNPINVVGYALRIPGDYAVAVGASALLGIAAVAFGALGRAVASLPVPVLAGVAGAAVSTYVPLVTARVLGLLLWVHGAKLGCLPEDEAWEPLLPGVEPRGTPPETERPPQPEGPPVQAWQRPAEISLDEAPEPQAQPWRRPEAISLDEPELPPDANPGALLAGAALAGGRAAFIELPPEPAPTMDPAAALAQAVEARDFDRAVELYRQLPALAPQALPAPGHFAVGRTAAFKGDYPLAVRALKASIAAGPSDPDMPRAYVMLARIHAEKLGQPEMAEKVYRFVAHRFPGTEAAKFAQQQLARGGTQAGA